MDTEIQERYCEVCKKYIFNKEKKHLMTRKQIQSITPGL